MSEENNTRAGVTDDMPREKALAAGNVSVLTEAELLAILLRTGVRGCPVMQMARNIIGACDGQLSRLAAMSIQQIMQLHTGIGLAKAVSLQAAITLGIKAMGDRDATRQRLISVAGDVYDDMRQLAVKPHEEFWVLYLSQAHRVQHRYCVSQGGTAATVVDVKLVVKRALDLLTPAMILVHNHPSGNPQPSPQDDALTHRVSDAAALMDLRVLDHVIIAGTTFYSYADQGRL